MWPLVSHFPSLVLKFTSPITKPHFFDSTYFKKISFSLLFQKLFIFWLHWVFISAQTASSCGEWGLLYLVVHGLRIAVASFVVAYRLQLWINASHERFCFKRSLTLNHATHTTQHTQCFFATIAPASKSQLLPSILTAPFLFDIWSLGLFNFMCPLFDLICLLLAPTGAVNTLKPRGMSTFTSLYTPVSQHCVWYKASAQ